MNITSAKYGKDPLTGEDSCVNISLDGVKWSVPIDGDNSHYQVILEWVADGNAITPSDPYIPPEE
tara:strand:- start:641 stop:835 length:195 start_codon:yes stop_codon:yes gene_type:complete